MRLERMRIRNFLTFADTTIQFAPSTVLIGANDSGKSAVVDALAWLFSGRDRHGRPPTLSSHLFESRLSTETDLAIGRLFDDRSVEVAAEFGDLNEHERTVWASLLHEGRLTLGRRLDDDNDGAELHLLVTGAQFDVLAGALEQQVESQPDRGRVALIEAGFERHDDAWWMSLQDLADRIAEEDASFLPRPWPDPTSDFPTASGLVLVRGPEFAVAGARELLRPLIAQTIRASLAGGSRTTGTPSGLSSHEDIDRLAASLQEIADLAIADVSEAFSDAIPGWVGAAAGAVVSRQSSYEVSDRLVDLLIGEIEVELRGSQPGDPSEPDVIGRPLDEHGAGTRRAAAMAALELFRDPAIWPPSSSVVLAVEEPEVGLHAAAQRRIATALSGLPTYGVQVVVVSHSATFINAAPSDGLRLIQSQRRGVENRGSIIVEPQDLREIVDELGILPADVLLARRFIVVEGASDALILGAWARSIGADLRSAGVQLVPVEGHTTANLVARFLTLAFEGAEFLVLLDQGRDTEKTRREIESRLGGRVSTRLLRHQEIEGYFAPVAVERWLAANAVAIDSEVSSLVASALAGPNYKRGLRDLTQRLVGREYRADIDGGDIAALTLPSDVRPEIQGLLTEIVSADPISHLRKQCAPSPTVRAIAHLGPVEPRTSRLQVGPEVRGRRLRANAI